MWSMTRMRQNNWLMRHCLGAFGEIVSLIYFWTFWLNGCTEGFFFLLLFCLLSLSVYFSLSWWVHKDSFTQLKKGCCFFFLFVVVMLIVIKWNKTKSPSIQLWHLICPATDVKGIVLEICSPLNYPRCRWVYFYIRFGEM